MYNPFPTFLELTGTMDPSRLNESMSPSLQYVLDSAHGNQRGFQEISETYFGLNDYYNIRPINEEFFPDIHPATVKLSETDKRGKILMVAGAIVLLLVLKDGGAVL